MRRITLVALLAVAACSSGGTSIDTTITGEGLQVVDDFLLLDVNASSATNGTYVSPRGFLGRVSAYYFGDATCPFCHEQFGLLNRMQNELAAGQANLLGVNNDHSGVGNAGICKDRDLPWLQDTNYQSVWKSWDMGHRDLAILDEDNRPVAVFNLTDYNLNDPANYDLIKAAIQAAVR